MESVASRLARGLGGGGAGLGGRVAAVVVTHNRKGLLLECVSRLLGQTAAPLLDVVVVDNASTDGTRGALSDLVGAGRIAYVDTGENLGGAGGFHLGMRLAVEAGYGRVWVMDDDCMPEPDALEELLVWDEVLGGDYGFLSSKVLWRDGSLCKMNVQRQTVTRKVADFSRNPVRVEMASFVSLLVRSEVVMEVGLPLGEFFIWTDDWEFTRRISRGRPCYLVTSSVVVHESATNGGADIASDSAERLGRYRYLYRNDVYLYRREGPAGFAYEAARLSAHAARVLLKAPDRRLERLSKIAGGTLEGLGFRPRVGRCFDDPSKVRVLELFGEPIATGGQESYVVRTVGHMDMSGLAVDALTPYTCESEGNRAAIESWGGRVFSLGLPFRPGRSRELIAKPLRDFLSTHAYDVVHAHSGSMSALAIAAAEARRAGAGKVIVHSHSAGAGLTPVKHAVRLASALRMRESVDVYAACSRAAGSAKFSPRACEGLVVLKNGVDAGRFAFSEGDRLSARAEFGTAGGAVVMGHVGRFDRAKNQAFALEAFAKARERNGNSELWLVGDGPDFTALEGMARGMGLDGCVRLLGIRHDIPRLLSGMDVMLFPSLWEGFPLSVLEAQCSGLPCVVSEGVTGEVDIIPSLVSRVPLASGPGAWADEALRLAGRRDCDAWMEVAGAGYDVSDTARQLREMYKLASPAHLKEEAF